MYLQVLSSFTSCTCPARVTHTCVMHSHAHVLFCTHVPIIQVLQVLQVHIPRPSRYVPCVQLSHGRRTAGANRFDGYWLTTGHVNIPATHIDFACYRGISPLISNSIYKHTDTHTHVHIRK